MAPAAAAKPTGESRWYPADDIKAPRKSKAKRSVHKPTKLRSSITPGTVCVLLSGRFRGKRVVFLKQMASGTLLVTGPYKVNGVPLRRVNQAYVIATSTKLDVSKVDVSAIDDAYFARAPEAKKTAEDAFFAQASKESVVSDQKKKDQDVVDASILAGLSKDKLLKAYLNAKFSLTKKDRPHEMVF
ncbi:RL6, ribosomal protein 6 [Tribonema minus]|uniref:60S ribosomal protein L6 n=1 Tax=Tribonema minus TaxID=303371 RepID=A0A835YT51_9STRA|nr:RL6, ribosomal protein 6 [Tribonema minus]